MTDPFAQVAALPGVADAVADARGAVDRLLGHRILRRRSAEVSAECALRGARASAALEGVAVLPLVELRRAADHADDPVDRTDQTADGDGDPERTDRAGDGARPGGTDRMDHPADADRGTDADAGHVGPRRPVDDPVVQGALRVAAEAGALTETWRRAPRQALARLHVLAAGGMVAGDELGRPRGDQRITRDPLAAARVPAGATMPPAPEEVTARLDTLMELLVAPTTAPAIVVAALVHGELLALRPFGCGDGLIARAAQRLTLIDRGLDPKSLTAPEVGHLELTSDYGGALGGYLDGTPAGVARWIRHCAHAVTLAARDSLAVCEAMLRG